MVAASGFDAGIVDVHRLVDLVLKGVAKMHLLGRGVAEMLLLPHHLIRLEVLDGGVGSVRFEG